MQPTTHAMPTLTPRCHSTASDPILWHFLDAQLYGRLLANRIWRDADAATARGDRLCCWHSGALRAGPEAGYPGFLGTMASNHMALDLRVKARIDMVGHVACRVARAAVSRWKPPRCGLLRTPDSCCRSCSYWEAKNRRTRASEELANCSVRALLRPQHCLV